MLCSKFCPQQLHDQGDLESEAFLYELLRNYQLLQIELNRPIEILYALH